jgi:hypothetical protein
MASRVLCGCEAQEAKKFRQMSQHFLKPVDFGDISVSGILNFVQRAGLLNA